MVQQLRPFPNHPLPHQHLPDRYGAQAGRRQSYPPRHHDLHLGLSHRCFPMPHPLPCQLVSDRGLWPPASPQSLPAMPLAAGSQDHLVRLLARQIHQPRPQRQLYHHHQIYHRLHRQKARQTTDHHHWFRFSPLQMTRRLRRTYASI